MSGGASDVGRLPSGRPGGLRGYLPAPEPPTGALPPKALPGSALASDIGWQGWTICLRQWALNHTHTYTHSVSMWPAVAIPTDFVGRWRKSWRKRERRELDGV